MWERSRASSSPRWVGLAPTTTAPARRRIEAESLPSPLTTYFLRTAIAAGGGVDADEATVLPAFFGLMVVTQKRDVQPVDLEVCPAGDPMTAGGIVALEHVLADIPLREAYRETPVLHVRLGRLCGACKQEEDCAADPEGGHDGAFSEEQTYMICTP